MTIPSDQLKGNNGDAYFQATEAGMYLGYLDSWDTASQTYKNSWQNRYWATQVTAGGSTCLKIMGVNWIPTTANGVFPVVLGVQNQVRLPLGLHL